MIRSEKLRVILDTNLWISWLISRDFSHLDRWVISGKIQVVFSQELLEEFLSVAQRPKLQKHLSAEDAIALIQLLQPYILFVDVQTDLHVCRDPKDNFLLNLAADAPADYLITGDKDLLDLDMIGNTRIINWAAFLQVLSEG
jgi:putative PIN family toxin of toxin-antitoxin system